jgi:hypothetical protein
MRNLLLTTAIMLAVTGASMASEQKNDAQPQSTQTQPVQMALSHADGSMDHASPAQSDCKPQAGKYSKPKKNQQQNDPAGDPDASQNHVEYGGAG